MTVKEIRLLGDPVLRTPADPVVTFDKELRQLVKDLTETLLDQSGAGRASGADANHFLYLVRANQLAAADPAKIKTPALIIYSPTDLVFPPDWVERTAAAIKSNGTTVETVQITGPNGHLNGVLHIGQAGPRIARFLAD